MTAKELFQAGKLSEAIEAVGSELRENATDTKRRTFLFEMLCFAGDYARAEKQLDILCQGSPNSELGGLFYRSILRGEQTRAELFRKKEYPETSRENELQGPISGRLNGKSFHSLADADPRIESNLEMFAAGSYMWVPFSLLASIEIAPPKKLRDLLWIPAVIHTAPAFQGQELGEALLPALSPFSGEHPTDAVRLGRATEWREAEGGELVPVGQKLLLADGEEIPILEVRKLEFTTALAAH